MIFITLGSQKFQMNRVLEWVDQLIESGDICEEVFAQTGSSTYSPKHFEYKNFLQREEFQNKMSQATIVLTHGGTGAIVTALKQEKRVIAVPRLKEFQEHVDDHQKQIIQNFVEKNYILMTPNKIRLKEVLEVVYDWEFDKFQSNNEKYIEYLTEYISKEF